MRRVDLRSVACDAIERQRSSLIHRSPSPSRPMRGERTRKAKLARPSVRPGRGWYRVPAFATRASVVVGPAKSRLANLTPLASPDWYWKDPEAGAASPRFCVLDSWRAARCAPRQAVVRDSIVEKTPIGGRWSGGGRAIDGELMDCPSCKDVARAPRPVISERRERIGWSRLSVPADLEFLALTNSTSSPALSQQPAQCLSGSPEVT
jgi:hypothetical protein